MSEMSETFMSGDGTGAHPDQAFCTCGSAWFHTVVAITHDMTMNGRMGFLTCADCGTEYPLSWTGAINEDDSWFDPTRV